jgi:pimeloyl-[acyl-carrier protein] methyl ester esterase
MSHVSRIPIVLLPGLDGTGDLFASLVTHAPPAFLPIVLPRPQLSADRDILETIEPQLPKNEPFVVLGESFSGPLAVEVARRLSSRVSAVVLCNTFLAPPFTSLLKLVPWSLFMSPPKWAIRRFLVGPSASPALLSAVQAAVTKTPRPVLAARMREVFLLPRLTAQERIRCPVLFLAGRDDFLQPNEHKLRQVIPRLECRKVAGPHLLLQVSPSEAWREISAFLLQAG